MSTAAVIDIGSNSIKMLIAERDENGDLNTLFSETIDARISEGISKEDPRLSDEGMRRGLSAIRELFSISIPYDPDYIRMVATSAVRDATNGDDFKRAVLEATGSQIEILSGIEEANGIGLGITCDPALTDLRDFHLFDLGGGSLECLQFQNRQVQQAASLQLGCVRLTEKFISDRSTPLDPIALQSIHDYSVATLTESTLTQPAAPSIAIGTGGTLATVRAILAEENDELFEESSPELTIAAIRKMRDELASLDLTARQQIDGLPEARADVFPTALTTLLAVADYGRFTAYHHSHYNLRYGIAKQMLGA